MGYTFPQLKQCMLGIMEKYGLNRDNAADLVGYFNAGGGDRSVVDSMLAGDFSRISEGAAALGIPLKDQHKKTCKPSKKTQEKPLKDQCGEKITAEKDHLKKANKGDGLKDGGRGSATGLEVVAGDIVTDIWADGFPVEYIAEIENIFSDFCTRFDCESMSKASNLQWRAACGFVGDWMRSKRILVDEQKTRGVPGGRVAYDRRRLLTLLDVFARFATAYKKIPLKTDFIEFTGISTSYFYGTDDRLSPDCIEVLKKADDIEQGALYSGLTDSRENPTGRIFYGKAVRGMVETSVIEHVSTRTASDAGALPSFTRPALTENGENGANTGFLQ